MTFHKENDSPKVPPGEDGTRRRASSAQAKVIIGLLIVLILVVAGVGARLISDRAGSGRDEMAAATVGAGSAISNTPSSGGTDQPEIDSVAMLENAGTQSVNPAPVPEAVDTWGDYVKNRSWNGVLRVFEDDDPTPVTNDDGSPFPATMNDCGIAMFLVNFRSVNEDVQVDAQLINAANSIDASKTMSDGWILTTNCDTPQFRFNSSTGISNIGDVAYDVTEYRQSSVADPAADPALESAYARDGSTAPEAGASEPYVVECLQGVPGPARWSDGTMAYAEECANTPEAQRAIRAEGLCGGLYAPEDVFQEEFEAICNRAPVYPPEDAS